MSAVEAMTSAAERAVVELPVVEIKAGANDRRLFDADELSALAASISELGLLQPISVAAADDGSWEIVAGERRFRACGLLGWETIPCLIVAADVSSAAMLAENTARRDLSVMEEATAYQRRLDEGSTIEEIARVSGRPAWQIRRRLGLLRLCPAAQQLVGSGALPEWVAAILIDRAPDVQMRAIVETGRRAMFKEQLLEFIAQIEAEAADEAALFDAGLFVVEEWRYRKRRATGPTRVELINAVRAAAPQLAGELGDLFADLIAREDHASWVDNG